MKIQLIVTGRAYHTAAELPDELTLSEGATVTDAISKVTSLLDIESLPASCLVAVGNEHLGTVGKHLDRTLSDGEELTLFSPVAGG